MRVFAFISVAFSILIKQAHGWLPQHQHKSDNGITSNSQPWLSRSSSSSRLLSSKADTPSLAPEVQEQEDEKEKHQHDLFDDFVDFLLTKQKEIIHELEDLEAEHTAKNDDTNEPAVFSRDTWGIFEGDDDDDEYDEEDDEPLRKTKETLATATTNDDKPPVGGITRVIQGGQVIEKGACSFTLIGQGILSKERAATIRARQQGSSTTALPNNKDAISIQEGDHYAAAALSMVLHSRSPHVPTFRSDVRVFLVQSKHDSNHDTVSSSAPTTMAWFGGGADLTPYYLMADDITFFHQCYADLCQSHQEAGDNNVEEYTYQSMKKACDDYFYLPARQEHRGTGGLFFDDMTMTSSRLDFVKGVVETWMPSWIPLVRLRQQMTVTEQERHWQLLRRGRYLEFNLLYDRGVRFGLANANPRVEGVMVSAPPLIAFEYNYPIVPDSREAELMKVLKTPKDWV
ncbi:hypothetical protein ACA910_010612 [Epithemia clementina (nom. ined.)]